MSFIGLRHWPRKPWYSTPSRRGLSKIQIRRADGDILTQTTAVSHKINLHCIHNSKRPCYLTVGCTQPTASKKMSMFFHVFHVMLFHILLQFFHVSLSGSPKEAIIGSVPNRHDIQSLNLESVGNIKSWRNNDFGGKTGATKKSIGEWISERKMLGTNWIPFPKKDRGKHKKHWNHQLDVNLL